MMDRERILMEAVRTLKIESEAIRSLGERLGEGFVQAVEAIFHCRGKVVVTGIGKSGIIGQKIASTLTSTGTPAIFLHSAEATHGDLGMLCRGDVVMIISYSGETEEIQKLIPAICRLGLPLILMTGNPDSTLGKRSSMVLDIAVEEEACSLGLAPTASTAAAMAMGDALAVTLLQLRDFKEEDFALIHPGGSIGRRWLKVADLMHTGQGLPKVDEGSILMDAIMEISTKGLGVTTILDHKGRLTGIITDGDLRRMIEANVDFYKTPAREVMTRNPKKIEAEELAAKALQIMEAHAITSLVITDEKEYPVGLIHLHDLLKAGVV
jgi:arabinose-5-phosphate isomerase